MAQLKARVDNLHVISPADGWRGQREILERADVVFSGWGAPVMDEEFLRHVPRLKIVFYAGGSVRYFVTEALWRRGVRLTTAQAINAVPVSEFAFAALILGLKRAWYYARLTREARDFPPERPMPGAFGTTVGLVSYGTIARLVREKLRSLEVRVLVYDPYLTEEAARRDGVTQVGLDELFTRADAVSVHTPHLAETTGLIKGAHFAAMRPGAFFLNTARGEVIDEPQMIAVLTQRPDLQAMLDVTAPEPPLRDSPLYSLTNVVLTPHIAGSVGAECQRMGQAMVDELIRHQAGEPLRWEITADQAELIA